jgi:hypothetical protein
MEEETERKMYTVHQRVTRIGMLIADSHDEAESRLKAGDVIRWDTHDIVTLSITEFNPLKSNEEVEKDDPG